MVFNKYLLLPSQNTIKILHGEDWLAKELVSWHKKKKTTKGHVKLFTKSYQQRQKPYGTLRQK